MVKPRKYNYLYKITNLINGKFYYGIHTTDNLDDKYMGSGTKINEAYEKYGVENFKKEILEFFDTRELAALREREIVNEDLIKNPNCYNIILGGGNFTTVGTATVMDKDGNTMQVPIDDERIKSGELVGATKGQKSGKVKVYIDGKITLISTSDVRYLNGELKPFNIDKTLVCDKSGRCFMTPKDDNRIKTGEINYFWTGRTHKEETKKKQIDTYKKIKHQQGSKNSQYGTCWITKNGISKKIYKHEIDLYTKDGWIKGRKMPSKH